MEVEAAAKLAETNGERMNPQQNANPMDAVPSCAAGAAQGATPTASHTVNLNSNVVNLNQFIVVIQKRETYSS